MPKFDGSMLRSVAVACLMGGLATVSVAPHAALAQPAPLVRGLPDFTDLVDQVGPSVVNIRTVEKASSRANANGMDEEMLEFFAGLGYPSPMLRVNSGLNGLNRKKMRSHVEWDRVSF